jgi:hypothetical protein
MFWPEIQAEQEPFRLPEKDLRISPLVTVVHQLSWALLALAFGTTADDETSGIRPLAAHSSVLPVAAKRITSWQRLGPFKHRHSSEEWLLVGFQTSDWDLQEWGFRIMSIT